MISRPNDLHHVHYYVLIMIVNSLYILIHLFIAGNQRESTYYCFICREKETEAQTDQAASPSRAARERQHGFETTQPGSRGSFLDYFVALFLS